MLTDEDNKYLRCVNCIHCKIKNESIYCVFGEFKDVQYMEVCLLSPYDFDCWYYESD